MTDFKFKPGDVILHKASGEKAIVYDIQTEKDNHVHFAITNHGDSCNLYFLEFDAFKRDSRNKNLAELTFDLYQEKD